MSNNIVNLLLRRERGFHTTGWDKASQFLAESSLFCEDRNLNICTVPNVPDSDKSTYIMDSTERGEAAVARTNHSIVFIDTVRMRVKNKVYTDCRTIWTLAYHPFQPDLLVAGSLGGSVFVFRNHELIAQRNFIDGQPITSVCFYPHKEHVLFSHNNFVYIWNWPSGNLYAKMKTSKRGRVRFVKYNLRNDMLITGIECSKLRLSRAEMTEINDNTEYFMSKLMRSLDYILNELELSRDLPLAGSTWRKLIKELNTLPPGVFNEPWPFVPNDLTLKIFDRRLQAIVKKSNLSFDNQPDGEETKLNQRLARARMFNTFFSTLSARSLFLEVFIQIGRCVETLCADESVNLTEHFWDYTWMGYTIQAWHFSEKCYPDLTENWKNVICACNMHNDSSVAISKCGKLLATVTPRHEEIEVHSLELTNLGQKLFTFPTGPTEKIVSLSFSPSSRFLLASSRLNPGRAVFLDLGVDNRKTASTSSSYNNAEQSQKLQLVRRLQSQELIGITCTRWLESTGEKILAGFNDNRLCYIR